MPPCRKSKLEDNLDTCQEKLRQSRKKVVTIQ
jgi:hypothetical protein